VWGLVAGGTRHDGKPTSISQNSRHQRKVYKGRVAVLHLGEEVALPHATRAALKGAEASQDGCDIGIEPFRRAREGARAYLAISGQGSCLD
jgi:hypothetical protein